MSMWMARDPSLVAEEVKAELEKLNSKIPLGEPVPTTAFEACPRCGYPVEVDPCR